MWLHDTSIFSDANFLVCISPLLLTLPERERIYRDFLLLSISLIIMTVNEAELNFKIDNSYLKSLDKEIQWCIY